MRRIIIFTLLGLTLSTGAALADRQRGDHRGDYRGDRRGDYRGRETIRNPRDPVWHQRHRPVVQRRPIYVNNGYYQFHNGYRYRYARPVIQRRYFDYRVRPQIVVENYQPVEGYVWVPGQWQWNGAEWTWLSGHYAVDPSYSYDSEDGVQY
jgi:hypothetical protein